AFTFGAALLLIALVTALLFRARAGIERQLPRYATAGERFDYRVVVHNHGRRPLEALMVREALRDPRPGYAEWRRAREPGEERRNWFDREQGYFRWRWLIENRTPERVELDTVPPGERRVVSLWMRPRRRGRLELDAVQLSRAEPLGLLRGLAK